MPSYSSEEFFRDWRYAVSKDFTTTSGSPFPYAPHGSQEWGDELHKITVGTPPPPPPLRVDGDDDEGGNPHDACLSADGKRLAVAIGTAIHIVDAADWSTTKVLRGHLTRVSALAFKPDDADVLVSSDQQDHGRAEGEPTIIAWRVDRAADSAALLGPESLGVLSFAAAAAAAAAASSETRGEGGGGAEEFSEEETSELVRAFAPAIGRVLTRRAARENLRFGGRLQTNFGAEVFSGSGRWMLYMPGERPRSNRVDDRWIVRVCSLSRSAEEDGGLRMDEHVALEGHTDAIMWMGFSPDEALVGTVAWDRTARIWDVATGRAVHVFGPTAGQNWTGGFSGDGRYFAATCGDGSLGVYSLADGSTHWNWKPEGKGDWKRALSWHPDGRRLAVAGRRGGTVLLLDVEAREVLQERVLSGQASMPDNEEVRGMLDGWPEVSEVRFVDEGRKLVVWTGGDGSAEVYDLEGEVKWRFARGGTGDGPKSLRWRDANGKVTTGGGWGMLIDTIWEDRVRILSIDCDGLRVWEVPLANASG